MEGFLSLPYEVILHLTLYLEPKDLSYLSQTCRYLYSVINNNSVWKRFIPHSKLVLHEQNVKPILKLKTGAIEPICQNYLEYQKIKHLLVNWKEGHVSKFKDTADDRENMYSCRLKGKSIYKNSYMILKQINGVGYSDLHGIEIWDVRKDPILHSFTPFHTKNFVSCEIIYGSNWSNIVIAECGDISIYKITLPSTKFPLLYSSADRPLAPVWNEYVEHPGQCSAEKCGDWQYVNVNNYLIACKSGDATNTIHVWDVEKAIKVGSFNPPSYCNANQTFELIAHHGDEWLFGQINLHLNCLFVNKGNLCFVFNIRERAFNDRFFEFGFKAYKKNVDFFKSHIIVLKHYTPLLRDDVTVTVHVFNFMTHQEVQCREFFDAHADFVQKNMEERQMRVTDQGTLVLANPNGFLIINALTLETITFYETSLDTFMVYHQVNVLDNTFILSFGWPIDSDQCELIFWHVNGRRMWSIRIPFPHVSKDNVLFSERNCKMIFFNYKAVELQVLHFW